MICLQGCFGLKNGKAELTEKGSFCQQENELLIAAVGQIRTAGGINCAADIAALYRRYGSSITVYLEGLYILLIHDSAREKFFLFQDSLTSPVNMYYSILGEQLLFSTSLKRLLPLLPSPRSFAKDQLEAFKLNGFLADEHTLVEGVYKLRHHRFLYAADGRAEQFPAEYAQKSLSPEEARKSFQPVLDEAIEDCLKDPVSTALSGGYDSNYILYIAVRDGKRPVHCYSVGDRNGTSELPVVEKNVQCYPNVQLTKAYTDDQTLQLLPEIVWRLEGAVFQRGIFLQYELGRAAAAGGAQSLVLGECADQIFHPEFDKSMKTPTDGKIRYTLQKYPYLAGGQMILKKNGIMMNSFGIQTYYPYLSDSFRPIARALTEDNGTKKRFHVQNCGKYLPKEVLENISKVGGATNYSSLFEKRADLASFIRLIKNNAACRPFLKTKAEAVPLKQRIREWRKMLWLLRHGKIASMKENTSKDAIEEALTAAYLRLFQELFLSGKYDSRMNSEEFEPKLDSFIQKTR